MPNNVIITTSKLVMVLLQQDQCMLDFSSGVFKKLPSYFNSKVGSGLEGLREIAQQLKSVMCKDCAQ